MWRICVERLQTRMTAQEMNLKDQYARFLARKFSVMLAALVAIIAMAGVAVTLGSAHITRMIISGDHRFLLPASGLIGALLLLGADTVARTVMAPVILPVGIMTAFMGVPFFLYLFMKRRKEFW